MRVRKAAARRMTHGGMSGDAIKAVTGHTDLKQSRFPLLPPIKQPRREGLKSIAREEKAKQILTNLREKLDKQRRII